MATDRGDPARSTSVLVTVTVGDINEFAPVFQYSSEEFPDGEYTVETLSTARAGELPNRHTVGPPIKGTPNKEHLSIKDKFTRPNSYYTSTF